MNEIGTYCIFCKCKLRSKIIGNLNIFTCVEISCQIFTFTKFDKAYFLNTNINSHLILRVKNDDNSYWKFFVDNGTKFTIINLYDYIQNHVMKTFTVQKTLSTVNLTEEAANKFINNCLKLQIFS